MSEHNAECIDDTVNSLMRLRGFNDISTALAIAPLSKLEYVELCLFCIKIVDYLIDDIELMQNRMSLIIWFEAEKQGTNCQSNLDACKYVMWKNRMNIGTFAYTMVYNTAWIISNAISIGILNDTINKAVRITEIYQSDNVEEVKQQIMLYLRIMLMNKLPQDIKDDWLMMASMNIL